MTIETAQHAILAKALGAVPQHAPLESVSKPTVGTEAAAYYLNRRPQTLRGWAAYDGSGPLRPLRIHGRLAWSVAEIRKLLGVAP